MAAPITVPLFDLNYGPEETEAALRVLQSKWLTQGDETTAFEKEFAEYLGVNHAVAITNCTAALHLACLAAGAGPGDEVITSALTFAASANAIRYTGATPIFADVKSFDDWTLDPDDIERKITPRTKAILVVHYAGFGCDMERIQAIAQKNKLKIIEDCAHSVGASRGPKKLGSEGDFSCFSFFSNKNLSTGEGGMICTNDAEAAAQIRLWRSHGMTHSTLDRHRGHAYTYDVVTLGYNYRIDEIRSALGRAQLGKLDVANARRRELAALYKELFAGFDGLQIPFCGAEFCVPTSDPNYHIFPVLLGNGIDRPSLMAALRERGIQSSVHYRPVHTFSAFREAYPGVSLPLTEQIGLRVLTLPIYPAMSDEQVRVVVENLEDIKDCKDAKDK
ncbi:TPA: DegT/DnrJ/EryC1/StrS aminotransferase [Candidatus Sumerlaeota bacterium]|nr:DegT/DnrJ/EryC1/StrS aminotransferase [Candidatus Sumerlaeota bacterium]